MEILRQIFYPQFHKSFRNEIYVFGKHEAPQKWLNKDEYRIRQFPFNKSQSRYRLQTVNEPDSQLFVARTLYHRQS